MALRKELLPPEIDKSHIAEVMELIESIPQILEETSWDVKEDKVIFEDEEVSKTVEQKKARLKELTNKEINVLELENYISACSTEEIAIDFLMKEPPYIKDITLEELTELIDEFSKLEQISADNEGYYLRLLEKNFNLSNVSDYIFWPDILGIPDEPYDIAKRIIEDSKSKKNIICL